MEKKKKSWAAEYLRRLSIKTRLQSISALIVIFPLIIIVVFSSVIYYRDMRDKMEDTAIQSIQLLNHSISVEIEKYLNYAYSFIVSDEVNEILEPQNGVQAEDGNLKKVIDENALTAQFWTESYENVLLLDNELNVVSSSGYAEPSKEWLQSTADKMKKKSINHCWGGMKTVVGKNIVIFMKKIYSNRENGKQIGYLNFVFDERRLFRKIYNGFSIGNSRLFILNEDFRYLSAQEEKEKIDQDIREENPGINKKITGQSGSFDTEYNEKQCMMVYDKNDDLNWYLAMAIDRSFIFQGIYHILKILGLLSIVVLFISLGIMLFVSKSIIVPIQKLMNYTNKVEEGDYELQIYDTQEDEMGRLTRHCNKMVQRLLWYMKKREEELVQQRKLEIKNLQYQIQPHFLFNTLNTFKYIAIMNGNQVLGNGITSLCSLLRQTITTGEEKIPLSQEIENLKNYVAIQEFRYAGNMEVIYNIEEKDAAFKVPRMLLQPIVENCIMHGMKEDLLLRISIKAEIEEELLKIRIEDNGKGFVDSPEPAKKKGQFSGIGVENIRERISMIYHGKGRFVITSKVEQGTVVEIAIPCEE